MDAVTAILTRAARDARHATAAAEAVALQATDPAAYVQAIRDLHADGATYALLARATGRSPRTIAYTVTSAKGAYRRHAA